jgi:hypothetical protein
VSGVDSLDLCQEKHLTKLIEHRDFDGWNRQSDIVFPLHLNLFVRFVFVFVRIVFFFALSRIRILVAEVQGNCLNLQLKERISLGVSLQDHPLLLRMLLLDCLNDGLFLLLADHDSTTNFLFDQIVFPI